MKAMVAAMNFQLPPNSETASAMRSARVCRSSSTSLRLRVTRWRSISSVWRRRSAMAAIIESATSGLRRTKSWKCSRDSTARRASSVTVAVAERGLPSRIDISPKKSPAASSASVTSSPSRSLMWMRTRPPSMRYIAPPCSPLRKRTLPAGRSFEFQQLAQGARRLVAERGEERDGAQRFERHQRVRPFSGIETHLAEVFGNCGTESSAEIITTAAKINHGDTERDGLKSI